MAADKLARLKAQLLTSGLSRTDRPLCQVIEQLIDSLQSITNELINSGVIGGGSSGGINSGTIITVDDETTIFPNSRQLLAGSGIQFNDAQDGRRFISSVYPFVMDGEDGIDGMDGYSGSTNSATVDKEWSVLTNGSVDFPELIFVGGDVVMLHTP